MAVLPLTSWGYRGRNKDLHESSLVNFLCFPNTSQFQSISAAKKWEKEKTSFKAPVPPQHTSWESCSESQQPVPWVSHRPPHRRSTLGPQGSALGGGDKPPIPRGRQPWCDGAQGEQSSLAAFPPRPRATTLCQPSSDSCSRRGSLGGCKTGPGELEISL